MWDCIGGHYAFTAHHYHLLLVVIMQGFNRTVTFGVLPAVLFASGHMYFVQVSKGHIWCLQGMQFGNTHALQMREPMADCCLVTDTWHDGRIIKVQTRSNGDTAPCCFKFGSAMTVYLLPL